MKKRIVGIAMAAVVVAVSLAGCGAGPAETKTAAGTIAAETDASAAERDTATAASEAASAGGGGTLIVGFDADFPPMGFMDSDGAYTGFDLELAQEAAKRLDLEYVAQPISWDAKDMELETGNIDCIWNGFTITGREDDYEWTEAYMANTQVFVGARDSGIKSQADMVILEDSLSAEEYGVGFKKGNTELRDKVQAALEEMASDGTLKAISEKWFGEDVTTIGR